MVFNSVKGTCITTKHRTWSSSFCIKAIRGYKCGVSPLLPRTCRFYPSCSNYAIEAIQTHGTCKGLYEGFKRILRCHPFHPGGIDLVKGSKL